MSSWVSPGSATTRPSSNAPTSPIGSKCRTLSISRSSMGPKFTGASSGDFTWIKRVRTGSSRWSWQLFWAWSIVNTFMVESTLSALSSCSPLMTKLESWLVPSTRNFLTYKSPTWMGSPWPSRLPGLSTPTWHNFSIGSKYSHGAMEINHRRPSSLVFSVRQRQPSPKQRPFYIRLRLISGKCP